MDDSRTAPDTAPGTVDGVRSDADRRAFARHRPCCRLWVRDRARNQVIGEASDISFGGLRLRAPEPIPHARRYALAIEVSVDAGERPGFTVLARCAWHRARPDQQFEAGFEFIDLAPKARQRLAALIDEFGS